MFRGIAFLVGVGLLPLVPLGTLAGCILLGLLGCSLITGGMQHDGQDEAAWRREEEPV